MKTITLVGKTKTDVGKKAAQKLRASGEVPCILYGNGENITFAVTCEALQPIVYTPNSFIIELDVNGRKENCVMREIQFHPVSDDILHIDFYRVDPAKPVTIDIPVRIVGSSDGVKQGGKLQQLTRKVKVSALAANLPDFITVDITTLGLGKSVMVGEIAAENCTILTPKTTVICAVKMTRAAMGARATAGKK